MIEIHKRESELDSLFTKIKKLNQIDPIDFELISGFTKYLCVLVSGYVEKSICLCLIGYISKKASPLVLKHVERELKYFTNAKIGKIEELLDSFNSDWTKELQTMKNYDEIKGAINSLITDRHAIAHGNAISLSTSRLEEYYKYSKKLIKEIIAIMQ
jgi:hypothetical protein